MVQTIPCRNEAGSCPLVGGQSKKKVRRVLNRRGFLALTGMGAAFCGVVGGLVAYSNTNTHTAVPRAVVSVPLTVGKGDSLWSLARRYGDPGASILDRLDNLAKANEMSSGSKLVPGQRLLVPISNSVELARLPHNSTFTATAQAPQTSQ